MKKQILLLTIIVFMVASCSNNKPSLQEYFVKNNDNPNFISLDIPSSILDVSETSLNERQKDAYKSIKKLNVLVFKMTQNNREEYEAQRKTVQEVLRDKKYEDLMVINSGKYKGVAKYLGNDDAIDEVVIFGSDDENGFAIIRILGNKMKPENMMTLVEAAQKGTVNTGNLENQLKDLFGGSSKGQE